MAETGQIVAREIVVRVTTAKEELTQGLQEAELETQRFARTMRETAQQGVGVLTASMSDMATKTVDAQRVAQDSIRRTGEEARTQAAALKANAEQYFKIADQAGITGTAVEGMAKRIAALATQSPAIVARDMERVREKALQAASAIGATEKQLRGLNDMANLALSNAGSQTVAFEAAMSKAGVATTAVAMAAPQVGEALARAAQGGKEAMGELAEEVSDTAVGIGFLFGGTGVIVAAVAAATSVIIRLVRGMGAETKSALEEAQRTADQLIQQSGRARREAIFANQEAIRAALAENEKRTQETTSTLATGPAIPGTRGIYENRLADLTTERQKLEAQFTALGESLSKVNAGMREQNALALAALRDGGTATREQLTILQGHQASLRAELDGLKGTTDELGLARASEITRLLKSLEPDEEKKKKTKDVLKEYRDDLDRLQEKLTTLASEEAGLSSVGARTSEAFRPMFDVLAEVEAKAPQFKARVAEMRAELERLQQSAKDRAFAEAGVQLQGLFTNITATQVDDLRAAADEFARLAEKNKDAWNPEVVAQIKQSNEQLIQTTGLLERINAQQEKLSTMRLTAGPGSGVGFNVTYEQLALLKQKAELEAEIQRLQSLGAAGDQARLAAQKELADVLQRLRAAFKGTTGDQVEAGVDWLRTVTDVLGVLQGIMGTMGGISDETRSLVGAFGQVVVGATRLVETLSKAGSLSKALGSSAGVLGLLGGAGAIVGGVSAILGTINQKDPAVEAAKEEAKRQHLESLEVLRAIQQNTADLAGKDLTGTQIAEGRSILDRYLAAVAGKTDTFNVSSLSYGFLQQSTAQTQRELDKLKKIADELGIPFRLSTDFFKELKAGLDAVDFRAFTDTFAGWARQLQITEDLFGTTDQKALEDRIALIKRAGSAIVSGIDVSNAEGRAAAIEQLTGVLKKLFSGEFKDLGGLTLDQTIAAVEDLIRRLLKMEPAAQSAAEAFQAFLTQLNTDLDELSVSLSASGADPAVRLTRTVEFFIAKFPQLGAVIGSVLDDSTTAAEKLSTLKSAFAAFVAAAEADGTITPEEWAIIKAFEAMIAEATAAADAIGEVTSSLSEAASLSIEAELKGLSDAQVLSRKLALFGSPTGPGKGTRDKIAAGFDVKDSDAYNAWLALFGELFDELAKDGLTDEERAILDEAARIRGIGVKLRDDYLKTLEDGTKSLGASAATATEKVLTLAEKLDKAFSQIDDYVFLQGLQGNDALNTTIQGKASTLTGQFGPSVRWQPTGIPGVNIPILNPSRLPSNWGQIMAMIAGGVTPENWAQLRPLLANAAREVQQSNPELYSAILDIMRDGDRLKAAPAGAGGGASSSPSPTPSVQDRVYQYAGTIRSDQANTMLDLLRTMVGALVSIRDMMASAFAVPSPGALYPPSAFVSPTAGAGGATIFQFVFNREVITSDLNAFARTMAAVAAGEIDRSLNSRYGDRYRNVGDGVLNG